MVVCWGVFSKFLYLGLPWVFVCGFAAGFCCGFRFLSWVLIGYGGGADWVWWRCSLGLVVGGCFGFGLAVGG